MKLLTKRLIQVTGLALVLAAAAATARAQDAHIQMSQLDRFNDVADKVVTVDVGESLINLALSALSDKRTPNEAKIKQVLAGLKGVYVKRFQFDKEGAYTTADVDFIRAQLNGPGWVRVANVRSKREGSYDVVMMYEGTVVKGLAVLAAEPKALTVVNVIGAIDISKLSELEGNFGIPKFGLEQVPGATVQDNRKDKQPEAKQPENDPKKPR